MRKGLEQKTHEGVAENRVDLRRANAIGGIGCWAGFEKDGPTPYRPRRVSDKADNPIPGSLVFLKNLRTNSVSSRYVDDDGNYRFSGLDPNVDYEVHAEVEGAKSPSRTVTSLDSRKEIVLNLKIDRKKS